jgi:hypothetical protein
MPIDEIVAGWPAVQERWCAWWEHEVVDRVLIAVTAPRANVPPPCVPEADPKTQWTSVEHMIRRSLEGIRTTYYGGDAVPFFSHNWSVGFALYLGCEPHFAAETVWVDPAPVGTDGYPHFGEDWRDSPWWAWMLASTRAAAQAGQGHYLMQALWGNHAGDNLALARGTENLLLDMATHPAWVKQAVRRVSDIQIAAMEAIWQIMGPGKLGIAGSGNYVGCWSPGRTSGFDCDFSCMISPDSFREFFLPPLIETMHTVDHRIYHLDGGGALQHLDALLALPELHAIQWVPGAGHEEILQWLPLIRRVQAARKGVAISLRPDEVNPLLDELRPEGLFLSVQCPTEADARALLERVARRYGAKA